MNLINETRKLLESKNSPVLNMHNQLMKMITGK